MEKTTAFSGTIPANYDRYLGPFLFEPYALDIVSRLQDKKYSKILEIACGTGRVTIHLANSVNHDMLFATDLNPDMIEIAKKRIVNNKKIKWMQADALELPFEDESFDLVVFQFGIMFFPDKLKGLQEVYRVLRKGGRIIFNTWDKVENIKAMYEGRKIIKDFFENNPPIFYNIPFSMFDEVELNELTLTAGFKDVTVSLVKKEGISPSAKELATGMVDGNPVYIAINERDPLLIEPIKEQIQKVLIEKFSEPVKSPLQAWIIEGIK